METAKGAVPRGRFRHTCVLLGPGRPPTAAPDPEGPRKPRAYEPPCAQVLLVGGCTAAKADLPVPRSRPFPQPLPQCPCLPTHIVSFHTPTPPPQPEAGAEAAAGGLGARDPSPTRPELAQSTGSAVCPAAARKAGPRANGTTRLLNVFSASRSVYVTPAEDEPKSRFEGCTRTAEQIDRIVDKLHRNPPTARRKKRNKAAAPPENHKLTSQQMERWVTHYYDQQLHKQETSRTKLQQKYTMTRSSGGERVSDDCRLNAVVDKLYTDALRRHQEALQVWSGPVLTPTGRWLFGPLFDRSLVLLGARCSCVRGHVLPLRAAERSPLCVVRCRF